MDLKPEIDILVSRLGILQRAKQRQWALLMASIVRCLGVRRKNSGYVGDLHNCNTSEMESEKTEVRCGIVSGSVGFVPLYRCSSASVNTF